MNGTRLEHFSLFGLAFIAAIWFFVAYPSQDPRSIADLSFDKKEIELRAAEKLSDLGFSISEYTISDVSFKSNINLLDSLQRHLGRPGTVEELRERAPSNIKVYFWEVSFEKSESINEVAEERGPPFSESNPRQLQLRMDTEGRFIALINQADHLPQTQVKRKALNAVFVSQADSVDQSVMTAVSDSLLGRLLYFDIQKPAEAYTDFSRTPEAQIRSNFKRGIPYRHSINDAQAMSDYYLAGTGWNLGDFERDSVFIKRVNSVNAANVRYVLAKPVLGQHLQLDVVVAPTGALFQMQAAYNSGTSNGNSRDFVWGAVYTIIIFGLGFAGLFIFFFRMRSRAIDTHSALVAAVVMGLIVPLYIFLGTVDEINPFSSTTPFDETLALFLQMGVVGALVSIGFFVLVALSDSIARQHWPEKLASYDYLRQGMLFNKPIGVVLLRSVGLAFILAGFWTLLLYVVPGAYVNVGSVFLSEDAAWPPLFLLLRNLWFSFSIMLAVFLAISSQVYGQSNNKIVTILVTAVASGILVPVFLSFGPPYYEMLMGFVFGLGLVCIYIKWDFLTLMASHFLFLGILGTATGWMVADSPDTYIFLCFIGFLVLVIAGSSVAVFKGKEERSLPGYIPSYVEELAQEERIKQELQIAREVQQSFLPTRLPQIPRLDIAAICKPAYETGGDYYDFMQLDKHRAAIAIGDVSGKGIQAAFYMTFVKGLLHSLCHESDSPAEVLKKTNRLFCENASRGTFISLVYGIIDLKKNVFTFARAGHNPILHVNRATGQVKELQPQGLGIGLTKEKIFDNKIEEIKLSITEDDLFLLYTDGIVEALNEKHEFYGTKNLTALIKKQKDKASKVIVSAVSDGVKAYIGKAKQHDDMTLMAVRCKDSVE